MRQWVVGCALFGGLGCDGDSGPAQSDDAGVVSGETRSLVLATGWAPAPPNDDPFADRPVDAACEAGFGIENAVFEISTDLCLYGDFAQPSLEPIRAGDAMEFVAVHDALFSEEPDVSAHIGIAVGPDVVWEVEIPIPSPTALLRPGWTAPADAPAGTPIRLHVHNHGVNNYRIHDVAVTYE